MVRKILLIATLLAVGSPLVAQEEAVWSSRRPDGQAPLGVVGARVLDQGEFQITYRFVKHNSKGVWEGTDSLFLFETLDFFTVAPLALENITHWVGVAVAATPDLTLTANMSFSQRRREHYTETGVVPYYAIDVDKIGDLEITGLYEVFREGTYRAHVQLGALIPTGSFDVTAETPFAAEEPLPYDMRPGGGTFAVLPGFTVAAQNEFGTVGAQVRGAMFLGTNSEEYAPGDRFEATGWASYRANDYFSFSGRVHYETWRGIEGRDQRLDRFRDPGNEAEFLRGERVYMPLGVNFYLPEGSRFAGHRLALEWLFPVHQEYDWPQLGADWGVTVGWQAVF
jgi:hypothetical protein